MTETADGGDPVHPLETSEAQAWFRAVESLFLELRGAPLLLSPADRRVARGWFEQGVPLDLVRETMRELVAKRREREPEARVSSLRYFDRAVRGAWRDRQEARGPRFDRGGSGEADEPSVEARLRILAEALPSDLTGRERWVSRLTSLAGPVPRVEAALEALDRELLATLEAALAPVEKAAIEEVVERALARGGAASEEGSELRTLLFRRELRRRRGIPLLTLF